ncbi:M23 family metallopeptidase [Bradyrhizobium jicamae]|uniref:M23 family metallopeptidase n=1 Tax=Bradyrhizobium jicamae TaxID=280332 RepID=UPI001BAB2463|nr:M23 family metallopeptidase [Bradyrhizobium jicamae]MBR0756593.1 M23 family metallopeptidase [Bradyrhizobium jicamae]
MNESYRPYIPPRPPRPFQRNSEYGWRTHPVTGEQRFHAGVDYRAPAGTPIPALTPGEVVYSGLNEGYGNTVVVRTTNGYSLYAHMQDGAPLAQIGDRVWPGDVIGHVGSTGTYSTGNHLHYSIITSGKSKPDGKGEIGSYGKGEIGFNVDRDHTANPDKFDTAIHYPNETLQAGRAMFGPTDTNDALAFGSRRGPLIAASPLHQFGLSTPDTGISFDDRFGKWTPTSVDNSVTAPAQAAPRGLPSLLQDYLEAKRAQADSGPASALPNFPDDDESSFANRFGGRPPVRRLVRISTSYQK